MSEYRNIIRFRKTSLLALALAACACSPAEAQDQRSHEGRTWAGTISISYTWDEEGANGVITSTANLRLRETREQPITDLTGRVIGSKTTLVHTASSIRENYAGVAGTAGGNPGVACEGSGPAQLSGEAGTIWRNSSGTDATGVVGFSFPAEGTYIIDLNTAVGSQRYPVRCANGATHESAFTAPPIGMGVQEDPGRKIEDRGARMRGSYRGNWNAGQIQVTWDLRGTDCRDPKLSSGYYERDPFGRETPSDIAPSCESCPGGNWKLNIGEISYHPSQREEPQEATWHWLLCPVNIIFCLGPDRKITPQCVYTYESIWTCTTTGEVTKRTKTKIEDRYCQPKG